MRERYLTGKKEAPPVPFVPSEVEAQARAHQGLSTSLGTNGS